MDKCFDVKIQVADGEEIPCHKIMLAGSSLFFENLIEQDESLDVIDLKKYQKCVMKPLIDYVSCIPNLFTLSFCLLTLKGIFIYDFL